MNFCVKILSENLPFKSINLNRLIAKENIFDSLRSSFQIFEQSIYSQLVKKSLPIMNFETKGLTIWPINLAIEISFYQHLHLCQSELIGQIKFLLAH